MGNAYPNFFCTIFCSLGWRVTLLMLKSPDLLLAFRNAILLSNLFCTQEKIGNNTVEINDIELELSCLLCLWSPQCLHGRNYNRLQHHGLNRQDHSFGDCPRFCHGRNEVQESMSWHIIYTRQCFEEYNMKLQWWEESFVFWFLFVGFFITYTLWYKVLYLAFILHLGFYVIRV